LLSVPVVVVVLLRRLLAVLVLVDLLKHLYS